jgi:hypothetical protein
MGRMAVLTMQVEQLADVVILQKLPAERGGSRISQPPYEIRKQMRVWTAVCKGCGLATNQQTDLSRGANDNVIVSDMGRRGEKIMRIINIYDQCDMQTRARQAKNTNWPRSIRQGDSTILIIDCNEHSH